MTQSKSRKIGLFGLIAMVVGAMIGGGIFDIPQNMAASSSLGAVIIAWILTGIGMMGLAYTFKILAEQRPDLNIGIYSYARAGFGRYVGFNSAWGYWIEAITGNVAYAVMLNDSFGRYFPVLLKHQWPTVIFGIVLIWIYNFLVLNGVKEATFVNNITVVIKFISIAIILICMIIFFRFPTFFWGFWGQGLHLGNFMSQVKAPMLVTLWCFIGIEGAVVISNHAKKKSDVGKATVIGYLTSLIAYVLVSIIAYGIYHQPHLSTLTDPSTAYLLKNLLGPWFIDFVTISVIISVGGSWIAWTVMMAQLPYAAAKGNVLPSFFARENKKKVPSVSLYISSVLMSLFMLLVVTANNVYLAAIDITGVLILPCYLLSSMYLWKIAQKKEIFNNDSAKRHKSLFIGILSTVYCLWLLYAAGLNYLLISTIIYAVGIIFFWIARKENPDGDKHIFTKWEAVLAITLCILAVISIYLLITKKITF